MQHGYVSKSRASPPNALYMIHFRRKPLDFLLVFNLVNLFRSKRTRHTRESTFGKNLHNECSILICQIGWLSLHCSCLKADCHPRGQCHSDISRGFCRFLLCAVESNPKKYVLGRRDQAQKVQRNSWRKGHADQHGAA